ncbi:MAG: T9SS type A sorting domain-containing protein [Candidatus Cloacimonetes bacterium]|nr:T9SS type A sorting domain-containing protein [Candidatus Cloacimonadota bacterium]
MKKMGTALIIYFLIILINVDFGFGAISQTHPNMQCLESNKNYTSLKFKLPEFSLQSVSKEGMEYKRIVLENEGRLALTGKPDLPVVSRIIAVPEGASIIVELKNIHGTEIKAAKPYPFQNPTLEGKTKFYKDKQFYTRNELFPKKQVSVSSAAVLRDFNVVNVSIYPFQYDPAKNKINVIEEADIKVFYKNSKGDLIKENHEISRSFEPLYKANILNYENVRTDRYQLPSYLFIYPDEPYVSNYLSYLMDWKHRKGFKVYSASTAVTGSGATSIKDYIENAYDNWDDPPEFVCLVGDAGGTYSIPTAHEGGGEGDQYYALLEGNDLLADVMIGRLSFNSLIEFQTIINKILSYEQNPYMDDSHWFTTSLLVGDPSTSGPSCVIVSKYIKEMIKDNMSYFTFDEVYSSPFVSGISNGFNNGASYFNYRGWYGMSGWSVSDVYNLNNGYMLPFAVVSTCGTGNFEGTSDCVSEAFTKAGSPSTPKGTIGTVGTATMDTHTTFNNALSAGVAKTIYQDRMYYLGGALNGGKITMWQCFPQNPNNWVTYFSYWNNLMGDPGLEIWTNVPKDLVVNHESQVAQGSNYFAVEVENDYGNPIQNATVCILKGDDLFEVGYTDTDGEIQIPISDVSNGQVKITASKHNYKPYQNTFSIVQYNQFPAVQSYVIDDDSSGTSSGNDNQQINPGESIEMPITLVNNGNTAISDIAANLYTNSLLVTITDDRETFGDLAPGETATSDDDYDFSIAEICPDGHEIVFTLEINDGDGNSWEEFIILTVKSSDLRYDSYVVVDGNNGILDPGETSDLKIAIKNEGYVTAENVSGILSTSHDNFTIHDSIGYFGEIYSGSTVTNNNDLFEVEASSDIVPGTTLYLDLNLSGDNILPVSVTCKMQIGESEMGDPLPADAYGYYCYDSGDTSYDIAPSYTWMEIDPDMGGDGQNLNLYDNGNTGDIADIDMPFNIKFYGITYNTLTVCSNGWIAPGETEQYSFMNSPVPGPIGPTPMIAGFWDDLKTSGGDVYYYYDTSQHIFIVEWSQLHNDYNNAMETFQIILFDQNYYPTPTGDCDILVQYKEINNVNAGSYSGGYVHHGQYSTIGIENHNGTIGLQYTFNNEYPPAAMQLEDEMAILFTTKGSQVLDPPIAVLEPDVFNFELEPGASTSDILTVENQGPSNLYYSITKEYQNDDKGSGGQDSYGYEWIDSDENNGPEYNWVDISGNYTELNFDHNDYAAPPVDIGFDFEFYGETYDELIVNPNGWIGFGDDWTDYHNYSIPRQDAPKPAIFGFWDDLDPLQGGNVYYYTNYEDSFVVWFDDVIHYPGNWNGTYDFEIILTADGDIKLQYRDVSGDIDSSTLGLQNADGDIGLEIAYNTSYVHDELAVKITRVIDWLTLDITSGLIFPDESENIELTVNTEDLEPNTTYTCNLDISTNDPNLSFVTIPVNLIIQSGPQGTVSGSVSLLGGSGNVQDVLIEVGDYSTSPNASGVYTLSVPTGTYTFTAALSGYDSYTQQIEVLEDQTTTVNPVLQYIKPPDNIWVSITELFNAEISWNSVNNLSKNKVFQSYSVFRKFNQQSWNLLTENIVDTSFIDTLYEEPDGEYRYGVKAVYETGTSDMAMTDSFTLNRFVDVSFDVELSNGNIPQGITVSIAGLDSVYHKNFIDTTDADGNIQFQDVFMANYDLEITKNGYGPIDEEITIDEQNNQFSYTLQYIHAIEPDAEMPNKFAILQNKPNPVLNSHSTLFSYQIPKNSQVTLAIFNIKGEQLVELVNQNQDRGFYEVEWDLTSKNGIKVGTGIYFYKLMADDKIIDVKKCLVF